VILGYYYKVYVPTQLLAPVNPAVSVDAANKHNLQLLVDQCTTRNGGMTASYASGIWFDDLGKPHHEAITVVTWWFDGWTDSTGNDIHSRVMAVVEAMFACGEKCVAVEYHNPHTPLHMEMHTPQ
jgi:hypothetical protein